MSLHKLNNNVPWIKRNHNHQAPHLADFLKIQTTLFAKKKKSLSTLLLSLGNAGAFSKSLNSLVKYTNLFYAFRGWRIAGSRGKNMLEQYC